MKSSSVSSYLEALSLPEQERDRAKSRKKHGGINLLEAIAQSMKQGVDVFVRSHSEPTIVKRLDNDGQRYYRAYDPITEDIYNFMSEDAVRIWIEQ